MQSRAEKSPSLIRPKAVTVQKCILLSSLLLPVVQGWLMMGVIRGCHCQLRIEIREICVAGGAGIKAKAAFDFWKLASRACCWSRGLG